MDFKQALDSLVQQIIDIVKELIDKAPYDKTYKGVIQSSVASGGSYENKVLINGRNRNIKSKTQYTEGDYVNVLVPGGEWQNAVIVEDKSKKYVTECKEYAKEYTDGAIATALNDIVVADNIEY